MEIKVVKNIGKWSARTFGNEGTIHEFKDGSFYDLQKQQWEFDDIAAINKHFSEEDSFQTVFELTEGETKMILCKQAMDGTACGKKCCCHVCEEKTTCKISCDVIDDGAEPLNGCEDAFEEGGELEVFTSKAAVVIKSIAELATKKKELEEQDKVMRSQLGKYMDECGIKSFENELVKITYVEPTTKSTIDSKALKKDHPDIVKKYSKISDVKGSVRISVK